MKKLLFACVFVWLSNFCFAQNQIKLYIQQIAANKVYIEYLQKGYQIARQGLTTIGNIKDGHFRLDQDFFAGLVNINPCVRNYAKVAEIISLNTRVIQRHQKALRAARSSNRFNQREMEYVGKAFDRLIDDCTRLIDELTVVLASDKLKMSDDERIKRIDALHVQMQDNQVFVNSFSDDLARLALQRDKEVREVNSLRY